MAAQPRRWERQDGHPALRSDNANLPICRCYLHCARKKNSNSFRDMGNRQCDGGDGFFGQRSRPPSNQVSSGRVWSPAPAFGPSKVSLDRARVFSPSGWLQLVTTMGAAPVSLSPLEPGHTTCKSERTKGGLDSFPTFRTGIAMIATKSSPDLAHHHGHPATWRGGILGR